MKLLAVSRLLISIFVLASLSTIAQVPDSPEQSPEDQAIEEEFIRSRAELGESHASGAREDLGPVVLGNPTQARTIIRVGISYSFTPTGTFSEFATRHFPVAEISHTAGTVHLIDVATGNQIIALDIPGTIVRTTRDSAGYHVSIDGVELGTFTGPLHFRPTDAANRFRVENIRRTFGTTQVPSYRGMIELSNSTGTEMNRLHVVNIIEIEDYVPGVVANESIASFHMEALKAQAVAARGYAIANIGRFRANFPYDIVDSTTSQVYRGVISEHVRAVQASAETIGNVASYNGRIIEALYSSSMGGHTENNEWIFNSPSSQLPGTNVTPYLRGIYDGDGTPPDTVTLPGITAFWTANPLPTIFDDCGRVGNRFSRWRVVLTAAQMRARITPAVPAGVNITNVQVTSRMPSGRAAVVLITLSNGTTRTIRGWDPLRQFFRPAVSTPALCGTTSIAANFVLNNPSVLSLTMNPDATVNQVTAWGGGWGHNVGMSQYGGQGRARAGQTFLQILKAYYTGVDIGPYPIDIGREPGSGPPTLRQVFYAPNAAGSLVVRSDGLKKLIVHINETYDLVLNEEELEAGTVTRDISAYLVPGLNTVQYNPVGKNGTATVQVVIE